MEEGIEEKMRGGGRRRERWDTTGFGGKRGGGRRREKWGVLEALLRTTLKVIYN